MTQTKHTPGPWKALDFDRVYAGSKFVAIAYPCTKDGYSTPESTANASLIAAAPDLLAEIEKEIGFLERIAENLEGNGMSGTAGNCMKRVKALRAAIAKAEGKA